ncbi:GumC family protein [Desulfobaculum sp. SPO524]|uniref:GumC family protein n=1 Tax=Desulfobaculum sp. SPO524 TaxID=3378071 RepID=UPI0038518E81
MEQYDVNIREYWRIFKKRKWVVLAATVLLGLSSAAFAVFMGPPPLYESICSVQFNRESPVRGVYQQTITWSPETDLQSQISLMRSYKVMQMVAERLGRIPSGLSDEELRQHPTAAKTVDGLRSRVSITRDAQTNIIDIAVTHSDPVFAQRMADTVALTYREMYREEQQRRAKAAISYLEEELSRTRVALRDAEEEFNAFTRANQLVSVDLQGENLLTRSKEIEEALRNNVAADDELAALLVRLERFAENPSGFGSDLYSTYADSQYETARGKLVELLVTRESLLEEFTYNHPQVIGVNRHIVEAARKMTVIVRSQREKLARQRENLQDEQSTVEAKINELMEKKLAYNRLRRQVDSYSAKVAMLEEKNREAALRQAERPEEVTIVKPAFLPSSPVNPPRIAPITSVGVFIGLVVGMIGALVMEAFDTSIGAIDDVEETLGAKVLGVIPDESSREVRELMREASDGKRSGVRARIHLVSHFVPKSMIAESFRSLRINVQLFCKERGLKTLAITSATPQEGKTVVSANLAVSMAQAGKRVLMVGADLRKPMVSEAFGVDNNPGLTDILLGNYAWRDAIKTVTDVMIGEMSIDDVMATPGLDNLHLMTAGTMYSNPSELIESKLLGEFVEEVRDNYDIIIFDTAPILSTADLSVLGPLVDGVLLVYRVGSISKELLKRSTVELSRVKSNLIGVVLNGMREGETPDYQDFRAFKYY